MTTVAYNHKDKEIAVDGQCTSGTTIVSDSCVKLYRFDSGWAAFCGSVADIPTYLAILNRVPVEGDLSRLDCDCIVVPDNRNPYSLLFDSLGDRVADDIKGNWALGSGREFALGALHAGASARDAVKAAIKYDIYSGGRVVVKKKGAKK